ncbi:MAG: hypothetical protein ACLTSX_02600 [Collinsella sp.]
MTSGPACSSTTATSTSTTSRSLEALKSPLFMKYYENQPFNDNHLRPCPMLENPYELGRLVAESGAHGTDLVEPETRRPPPKTVAGARRRGRPWPRRSGTTRTIPRTPSVAEGMQQGMAETRPRN